MSFDRCETGTSCKCPALNERKLVYDEGAAVSDQEPPLNRRERRARAAQSKTRTPKMCKCCLPRTSVDQAPPEDTPVQSELQN
jgi:hypothetical protein